MIIHSIILITSIIKYTGNQLFILILCVYINTFTLIQTEILQAKTVKKMILNIQQ